MLRQLHELEKDIMDTLKKAVGVSPLPTRQLGKNGPKVTAMGFGLMGLYVREIQIAKALTNNSSSAYYGPAKPDNERLALLDKAYEMGEWFWDSGTDHHFRITLSEHNLTPPSRHLRRQRRPRR